MSETAQGGIIVICGLIVFIYGILRWVIWGKSRAQRFIEKAQKNGCKATGTLVKTKSVRKSTNYEGILIEKNVYEYVVGNRKYDIVLSFESSATKTPPNYITVYYDPKNPKKAVYAGKGSRSKQVKNGCGFTVLATFCTMFLVAGLLAHLFHNICIHSMKCII